MQSEGTMKAKAPRRERFWFILEARRATESEG